jgi:hypothetical protein
VNKPFNSKLFTSNPSKWIDVIELPTNAKPTARRRRMEIAFVLVPLAELARMAEATNSRRLFVWAWIRYEIWRTKSATLSISNEALRPYGINRDMKIRALRDIARTGAITIQQCGKQAVVVTVNEKYLSQV